MSALENTGPYTGPNSAGLGALAVWARGRLALDIATAGYCRAATIAGCELLWRFSCSLLTGALKERTLPGEHVLPSPAAKDRERERQQVRRHHLLTGISPVPGNSSL